MGSISITGAQIGRQQRTPIAGASEDENEYRHAFLIIEVKRGAGVQHTRHVLCAESDAERDNWVDVLVRYVMGSYDATGVPATPSASATSVVSPQGQPRPSTSSMTSVDTASPKRMTRADIAKGSAVPISQLSQDHMDPKLLQSAPFPESSPSTSFLEPQHPQPDQNLQGSNEVPLSSSLPTQLDIARGGGLLSQRAASELGHYTDLTPLRIPTTSNDTRGPGTYRQDRMQSRSSVHPSLSTVQSSPTFSAMNIFSASDRAPSPDSSLLMSPDSSNKVKISGPINGTPIPAGYKFGARDAPSDSSSHSDRERKAKSRNFWGFARAGTYNLADLFDLSANSLLLLYRQIPGSCQCFGRSSTRRVRGSNYRCVNGCTDSKSSCRCVPLYSIPRGEESRSRGRDLSAERKFCSH